MEIEMLSSTQTPQSQTQTPSTPTPVPPQTRNMSQSMPQSAPALQGLRDQQGTIHRSRTSRRDDSIRKKAETELSRKIPSKRMSVASVTPITPSPPVNRRPKGYSNTVASLKPVQAITVLETARIVQAAQLMAAKRADAVLVVNEEGQLSGILTDKDIAFRVVAEGLDLRSTTVSQCMTRNPVAVLDKGPRNEALSVMVSRRFRHLPVISAEEDDAHLEGGSEIDSTAATSTNVVGLLDITKCVFDRLDDLEKKVLEDANIVAAMEALERRGHLDTEQVGLVRSQHGCPDLHSILTKQGGEVPEVSIKATVRDAAKVMKQNHQTAVLVLSSGNGVEDKLGGIFTTKDIVLRVIAAGLDPAVTSVVRVMTPHPDSVEASVSILDALKKLHVGHYLHLPVVEDETPVGLVDVLTLTMGMLDYLMNKETSKDGESLDAAVTTSVTGDGPMWNRFWNSTFNAGSNIETESHASLEDDHRSVSSSSLLPHNSPQANNMSLPRPSGGRHSIFSNNSTAVNHFAAPQPPPQHQFVQQQQQQQYQQFAPPPPPSTILSGAGSTYPQLDPSQFGYKLRDKRSGKVHRFTSSSSQISDIYSTIRTKTGSGGSAMVVSYEDEDGDLVLLGSNADVEEAVGMARRFGWERLILHIGETVAAPVEKASKEVGGKSTSKSNNSSSSKRRGSISSVESGPGASAAVADFLRDAPLAVNVALSAGIVIAAAFVISRMQRM
ncbi:hypothetical protein CcCBS67573_g05085 [Chytriomyces confervae]|uniref:CBS domain-containing protein n=1 Tax=Chytriomyces confervae TaxID=246404 RepID=A0A507FBS0_9FUNG|nr:hypothetical protein CcCBS67573_g05085 [Chytriomyces confervae]